MLLQRVLTVAVILPLMLAALWFLPNLYWGCLLLAGLIIAGREWARLSGHTRAMCLLYSGLLGAAGAAILWWQYAGPDRVEFALSPVGKALYGASVAFWLGIAPTWLWQRWRVHDRWILSVVGVIVLLSFWHALVWLQSWPLRLLLALSVVWVADTAAYFVGRRFGRNKLAPEISPGKTWEGVWGALVAVSVYWVIVFLLLREAPVNLLAGLILVLLLTSLSIVGDLFESWIKRIAGVKDSGSLLPGHGGLLDRVDSLAAVTPLAALYFGFPLWGG
jgi:phosphatidate cytidylyltransferase